MFRRIPLLGMLALILTVGFLGVPLYKSYQRSRAKEDATAARLKQVAEERRAAEAKIKAVVKDYDQMPGFVQGKLIDHVVRYDLPGYAWAQPIAWGVGTYRGYSFQWFAWADTQAYYQMALNIQVSPEDLSALVARRLSSGVEDASLQENRTTWIGLSSDWSEACPPDGDQRCDMAAITDAYVKRIMQSIPITFAVKGMVPANDGVPAC